MRVLELSVHFSPNIGGVETYLDDLVKALIKRKWFVYVLAYRPLSTKMPWKLFEKGDHKMIIRIPWLPDLFYKLVSAPLLEFIYLVPGLWLITPFILIWKRPRVVHAHGLIAGFVGVFWGKIFNSKVIISTHNIYNFPKKGIYREFVRWIFEKADYSLCLSKQAVEEIVSLGISRQKVINFTYWIDLERFIKIEGAKNKLGWKNEFVVFFIGRLVAEKGVIELLEAARQWNKKIKLVIAGAGPLDVEVQKAAKDLNNIIFLGAVDQNRLPLYYSGSDILIVPSVSEEGFGRVIIEALACELPIVGSNRGGIREAMDSTVGKLIDVTGQNIKNVVEDYYKNRNELKRLSKKCRNFAERRYSEENVNKIIRFYTG